MITVIIIVLCVVAYLLIALLAMLFWPLIVLMFVFYNITENIRNGAQMLGNKLARRMKK